jgi:sodium/potassium/calcium exchanger 6
MSEALAGITFLALANGAPDILTAVVAGTSSSDTTVLIPFGSLYGAAFFSMGFILSMVIYYSPENKLTLNLRETLVPLGFYIAGTLYLAGVSIFYKKMNITLALIFFSLYLVYIAFVAYEERKKNK